jgi:peptidoglycan hydrolase CwlO-like protein|tara:strand:+ start:422 stop:604 length:183 start_codon:yes stop_codon:yes gene_type:complete
MDGLNGVDDKYDPYMKEISEMQKSVHTLQIRQKELIERLDKLKKKITVLGGDPDQLEIDV